MLREKRVRFRLLVDTERLLLDLERKLQYSAMPIREWLNEIAIQSRFLSLPFVQEISNGMVEKDLETAWCGAIEETRGFEKEEIAVLQTLGTHLGKSDTATQLECIKETVLMVSECKEMAADNMQKAEKLYVWLGTCMGMAVALLLI